MICKNHQDTSRCAADLVAELFAKKPEMTVTFAAGDTPFFCYRELIRRQNNGELQLDRARYIGLDEWVGLGPDTEGSCIASMNRGYYHPAGIPGKRIVAFDGLTADLDAEIERMREYLRQYPLDLAVLGVGVNGHVGFNEPGITTTGDFSLVPLSTSTQAVGRKYFMGKRTPARGATITLQALMRAERVIILATGAGKRDAVAGIWAKDAVLPASAFTVHPGACYLFDEEASAPFTVTESAAP